MCMQLMSLDKLEQREQRDDKSHLYVFASSESFPFEKGNSSAVHSLTFLRFL